MKYFASFVFLLFSLFAVGQSTSGTITYKKIIHLRENIKEDKELGDLYIDIANAVQGLEYKLLFDNRESLFYMEEFMSSDGSRLQSRAISSGGGRGKYYHHLSSKNVLWQVEYFGKQFLVKIPLEKYQWEITDATKKIGPYSVRKAVTSFIAEAPNKKLEDKEVKIIAWFTTELPLAYGPLDIAGLPGLVLETTSGNVTFTASGIDIDPSNSGAAKKIEKPSEGELIKEEELSERLNKMMKKLRENS